MGAQRVAFDLPRHRVAAVPPEARGLRREEVALLVARPSGIEHSVFARLAEFLEAGDLVVVNQSETQARAVDARSPSGPATVHFSQPSLDGTWEVELRRPDQSGPLLDAERGARYELPDGYGLRLITPADRTARPDGIRLWRAALTPPGHIGSQGSAAAHAVLAYLRKAGRPIRYDYVSGSWPIAAYQTVFARRSVDGLGSAEMPSAARPFSRRVVTSLRKRGIRLARVTLHTGVSSQELGETPGHEWFEVSPRTARAVAETRAAGGRVVAVGTTVTRALETAHSTTGRVEAMSGWTDLVLQSPEQVRVVDGLITGWHPPQASHLDLLNAVAGAELTAEAYEAALEGGYLWHEFGDSALLLPNRLPSR